MNPVTDYRLIPVLRLLQRKKALLLQFVLAAFIVSLAAYYLFLPKYKAEVTFMLVNPAYTDRGSLYSDGRNIGYFAGEDDMNRFMTMASSDTLQDALIRKFDLAGAYGYDTTSLKELQALHKKISKCLIIYKEENNEIILAYSDKDAARAAAIANYSVAFVEAAYRSFYREMRENLSGALALKIREQDSAIAALTDTLSRLREQYGIYDIISPTRSTLMTSGLKPNGKEGYAKAIEQVQNVESVKDEFVTDRSRNITLLSQYTTGDQAQSRSLVRISRQAKAPAKRDGIGLVSMLLLGMFAGFMAGVCYITGMGFIYGKE